MDCINIAGGKLWGMAGGELEYVSQRVEHRQRPDKSWYQVIIIRFTDHDVRVSPNEKLIDGVYYELEFPVITS